MDELVNLLEAVELGANADEAVGNDTGGGEKAGLKRKHEGGDLEDELLRVPPVNDIYRSRQQKRVHT